MVRLTTRLNRKWLQRNQRMNAARIVFEFRSSLGSSRCAAFRCNGGTHNGSTRGSGARRQHRSSRGERAPAAGAATRALCSAARRQGTGAALPRRGTGRGGTAAPHRARPALRHVRPQGTHSVPDGADGPLARRDARAAAPVPRVQQHAAAVSLAQSEQAKQTLTEFRDLKKSARMRPRIFWKPYSPADVPQNAGTALQSAT